MKTAIFASLLLISSLASANSVSTNEKLTIETFETTQTGLMKAGTEVNGAGSGAEYSYAEYDQTAPKVDRFERVGQVISSARDFVAMGEEIYNLVQKGKPTNTTEHAPLSVVPKDPISKEIIEAFDLEGFSMPVQKKFTTIMKSGFKEVVRFEYMVVYSYGGSYNGAGKWIAGAEIIPVKVVTKFGWDFNASMKVSGIMNHGTKADPVAGLMMIVKYQMNSWGKAEERNDTFHITGRGEFKSYLTK